MIFGQSAGAVDTYTLGSLPQAPSLFKGGVAQSGGGRALPQASSANAFGALWAQTVGCSNVSIGPNYFFAVLTPADYMSPIQEPIAA